MIRSIKAYLMNLDNLHRMRLRPFVILAHFPGKAPGEWLSPGGAGSHGTRLP